MVANELRGQLQSCRQLNSHRYTSWKQALKELLIATRPPAFLCR
jgi:hypothetical protein